MVKPVNAGPISIWILFVCLFVLSFTLRVLVGQFKHTLSTNVLGCMSNITLVLVRGLWYTIDQQEFSHSLVAIHLTSRAAVL
jgi:hypothetical protein